MNILVIEDDQDIRDMICQSLSQANYQAYGCADVKSAKKSIKDIKPDCLIVDWMLPDSSGIELIRWLRRHDRFKQIPALMLTARSQESDKITGLESGADDYMTKPLSLRSCSGPGTRPKWPKRWISASSSAASAVAALPFFDSRQPKSSRLAQSITTAT